MTFGDVVKRAWKNNTLLVALLELTYDCNLDCQFCYNDRALPGARLDVTDWIRVLDDLAAMNVLNVVLSGGEPMTHPRFFEIGRAARERGFVVRIKTNGLLLRGDAIARVKKEIDPFVVEVSLHGATADVHDALTQVPGSFRKLVDNVRAAKSAGLRVKMNATLTRLNEHHIEGMHAIARDLDVPLVMDPDVTPRDDGDLAPLALAPSDDGLRALLAFNARGHTHAATATAHDECAVSTEKHCGAGSSSLCIDPVGNVYPCVQWRRRAGNVREQSIADIWRTSRVLDDVRALSVDVKRMIAAHGEAGAQMAFCPGTAESRGGSALVPYDAATRRAQASLVVNGKLRVLA